MARIYGTEETPRLCVFRSAKHVYAQLIDDESGKTLFAVSDSGAKTKSSGGRRGSRGAAGKDHKEDSVKSITRKVASAYQVGQAIAQRALEKKIQRVVFDRAGYKYHGRVRAVAEGARAGGLKF